MYEVVRTDSYQFTTYREVIGVGLTWEEACDILRTYRAPTKSVSGLILPQKPVLDYFDIVKRAG